MSVVRKPRVGFTDDDDVDTSALPSIAPDDEDDDDDYYDDGEEAVDVPSYMLPDAVKDFLGHFHRQLNAQNLHELQSIYSSLYPKLTERFFKDQPWPQWETIAAAKVVPDADPVFIALYKELYFRHLYASLQPSLDDRCASYENYVDLFNAILTADEPIQLELPTDWLYALVDEFSYQFQSFTQYRAQMANKTEEEIEVLSSNVAVWNVHVVLNVLHSLIEKSNINEQLEAYQRGEDPAEVGGPFGGKMLYRYLGYFSLVNLARLHTMLGDYHQALKVMDNIELNKKALYSRVSACQISLYYHVGFCYLMMRRYQDAVRTFTSILVYILRTQGYHQRTPGFNFLAKKREQLFHLLAIAMSLSPQRIDDNVHHQLWEKCGERMQRIQKGELKACEELFAFGCPKFLSPVVPNYEDEDAIGNFSMMPYNLQLKLFMREVKQQALLPTIRSYLKLYATMPLAKLASFLDMDVDEFRKHIHSYKHKATQLVWVDGPALSGEPMPSSDIDFFIDGDMVSIADVKVERSHGEYFTHQITKINSNSGR